MRVIIDGPLNGDEDDVDTLFSRMFCAGHYANCFTSVLLNPHNVRVRGAYLLPFFSEEVIGL